MGPMFLHLFGLLLAALQQQSCVQLQQCFAELLVAVFSSGYQLLEQARKVWGAGGCCLKQGRGQ